MIYWLLGLWVLTIAGIVVYLLYIHKATSKPAVDKAIAEVTKALDTDELRTAFSEAKKKEQALDAVSKTEGDDLVSSDLSKRGFR